MFLRFFSFCLHVLLKVYGRKSWWCDSFMSYDELNFLVFAQRCWKSLERTRASLWLFKLYLFEYVFLSKLQRKQQLTVKEVPRYLFQRFSVPKTGQKPFKFGRMDVEAQVMSLGNFDAWKIGAPGSRCNRWKSSRKFSNPLGKKSGYHRQQAARRHNQCHNVDINTFWTLNKQKMSTTDFWIAANVLYAEWWVHLCPLSWDDFGFLLPQNCNALCPRGNTEWKIGAYDCPHIYWQSSDGKWEGQRNCSLNIQCPQGCHLLWPLQRTWDSRYAPNLFSFTGARAVFFRVKWAVARRVWGKWVNCGAQSQRAVTDPKL